MLRFQFRNTILTPATIISILGLYFFMVVSLYPHPNSDIMYNYQYSIVLGYGSLFIPVAVVIPICSFMHYTGSQRDVQLSLVRSRLSIYTRSTVISAMLSGMAVTLGAFLLFTLTNILYCPNVSAKLP